MQTRARNGKRSNETANFGGAVQGCAILAEAIRFWRESHTVWKHAARGCTGWILVPTLSAVFSIAAAQSSAPTPTLPAGEVETRTELSELLKQIDANLNEATASGQQAEVDRLLGLKAQIEVLILQLEIEALQRENATLLERQRIETPIQRFEEPASTRRNEREQGSEQRADVSTQGVTDASAIRRQFDQLGEQQAYLSSQLGMIERQHGILLKQLGSGNQNPRGQSASPQQDGLDAVSQEELSQLRGQLEQLTTRQSEVDGQLQEIIDEHASLLGQLSAAETDTSAQPAKTQRTYVVRPGDSLSRLAQSYYGSAFRWPEILAANPSVTDPDRLLVGTVLMIP